MREATIARPVTVERLADVLGLKPFQLLAELIKRAVFIAPTQIVEDSLAIELAAEQQVRLRIRGHSAPGEATSPRSSASAPLQLPPSRQIDFGSDPDVLSPED